MDRSGIATSCSMDPHSRRRGFLSISQGAIPRLLDQGMVNVSPFSHAWHETCHRQPTIFGVGEPTPRSTDYQVPRACLLRRSLSCGRNRCPVAKKQSKIVVSGFQFPRNCRTSRHIAHNADAEFVLTCCFRVVLRMSTPRLANGSHADHVSSTHGCYPV